jgi:hypothetical protein
VHERPQIEFLADELRSIVEPDRAWIADFDSRAIECCDNITAALALPHFDRRRQPGEGVDHHQSPDLTTVE